jgi:PAS domain S-box-containing protein
VEVYITEEYRASVKEVLDNALKGKEAANFEFPLFTKDQKRVEVLLNATTRRDVSGNVVGVIGVGQDVTERKQAELEMTRVAKELQTFIDTANAPIFGIDSSGLVNEWNNKAAEITGFPKAEVMGQNLVEVYITEEYRASVKEVLDDALMGSEAANFEFPLFTKDQKRVDVLLNATTRRDVSGNVVGVIGVGQDVTERKLAELEMTRVAKELQTFIDTANAPIFGIDSSGLVNEWNNKAAEITGFPKAEVMGQSLVDVYISEDYRVSVKEVLDNALQGNEAANFEFPLFTKDQKRVEVLLNATTRRDVSGNVVGVIGVGQDITQRKQVEIEKTRVAQELQTFIDTANAPIFGIDAMGLVNEWNNKAVEITGFSRDEVMGRNLVEVYITEEFRASVKEVLDNALKGQEAANFEFPLFTKDERRLEVLLNATSRRDVTGKIVGVIGVGQDITEMRRLMNQEAIFNQAQAANEAKSQFLATMSHEMRTPLNVIMGMSQLILDTALTAEAQKFTEQIMTSSESLLFLINEILDLTKIEAGQLDLFEANFDVRHVVEDAVDSVASRALAKGLEICCYLDPKCSTSVNGDPDRLRQILLNLLSNAIKFTKSGQVYVVVEQEEVTATHTTFRFKVYDSGIGISDTGQKKLFNRFSQVDSSTTREFGGTGLGLAISKEFAELMNGSMGVNSTANVGSMFWFTAMFQVRPETHPPFQILMEPGQKLPTVMLVASNETLRNSFLRIIEGLGLNVISVVTTEELHRETHDYDVIIMCPSAAYEEGHSLAAAAEAAGSTKSAHGDDLRTIWSSLHTLLQKRPGLQSIILCPITQLSQAAGFKEVTGCHKVSRPTRMSVLHDTLIDSLCASGLRVDHAASRIEAGVIAKADAEMGSSEANKGHALTEKALFPYEMGGMRILIAVLDSGQGMVLKAILTREHYLCDICANVGDLGAAIRQSPTGWNFDVIFIELGVESLSVLEVVRQVRKVEQGWNLQSSLHVVGVVDSIESEECVALTEAGADVCMTKPIRRQYVTDIMAAKVNNLSERKPNEDPAKGRGAPPPALDGDEPEANPNGQERKVRVLVVDDDNGQRALLKTMLTKGGFNVDTAEDGDLAVKLAQRVSYDVILMDGFMPNKTGWEATIDIRAIEEAKGLDAAARCSIIGVTGATSKEDETKCFKAGMTDVISKPVMREALFAKILQWTQHKDKGRAEKKADNTIAGVALSPAAKIELQSAWSAVVLETDKTNRVVLKGIFKAMGTTVEFVSTHDECMKLAESKNVDMVVINTALDGIDSFATFVALRHVLESEDSVAKPIFAITAESDDSELQKVGFSGIFYKPFDKITITEMVKVSMKGSASAQMVEASSKPGCLIMPTGDDDAETGVRVLIVEDHWANRRLLEAMLKKVSKHGVFVMEAVENGQEAVNITSSRKYDIILMDCNMPIMDGWQATAAIRQSTGPNKLTPIIAVTANAMKGDREKCLASGMDDYISKPVDRTRLQEVLGKWLEAV